MKSIQPEKIGNGEREFIFLRLLQLYHMALILK